MHAAALVEPVFGLYEPAAHIVGAVAAVVSTYVPAGARRQPVEAEPGWYLPSVCEVAPSVSTKNPGEAAVHGVFPVAL